MTSLGHIFWLIPQKAAPSGRNLALRQSRLWTVQLDDNEGHADTVCDNNHLAASGPDGGKGRCCPAIYPFPGHCSERTPPPIQSNLHMFGAYVKQTPHRKAQGGTEPKATAPVGYWVCSPSSCPRLMQIQRALAGTSQQ